MSTQSVRSEHLFPASAASLRASSSQTEEMATLSSKWVRMHVLKLDEEGRPKKAIDLNTHKLSDRDLVVPYVVNTETGDMYLDDTKVEVVAKCINLALFGVPLYTLGHMVWFSCKTVIDIVILAKKTFEQMARDLSDGEFSLAMQTFGDGIFKAVPSSIADNLWNVVKAPFMGIALEAAALYGIFDPYAGRALEARIEQIWQGGASFKQDFRFTNTPEEEIGCWKAFVNDIHTARAFYLAHCFQPRGNISDTKSFTVLKREPVRAY